MPAVVTLLLTLGYVYYNLATTTRAKNIGMKTRKHMQYVLNLKSVLKIIISISHQISNAPTYGAPRTRATSACLRTASHQLINSSARYRCRCADVPQAHVYASYFYILPVFPTYNVH